MNAESNSNINDANSLGKGEVVSSILPGSTTKAHKYWAIDGSGNPVSAVSGRTEREDDTAERGKSVDSVHEKFTAGLDLLIALCMDCGMHPIEMADVLKRKAEELAWGPS